MAGIKEWGTEDVSAALETAIVAQLALFALFAFLNARKSSDALYFLAALTGLIALMLAGNFLAALLPGLGFVNTLNIALELLVGPALFFYVRQAQAHPKPLERRDTLHLVPALLGVAIRFNMIAWVDVYVASVLVAYLASSGWLLRRGDHPLPFIRFSGLLIVLFTITLGLRVFVAADSSISVGFRQSEWYPFLLGAILIAACLILFVSLQWPEIVNPISRAPKYARSSLHEEDIQELAQKLRGIIDNEQPHLRADLSLDDLAKNLDVSPRDLSQTINSTFGMNFSAFMNSERVKVAAQKLRAANAPAIKSIMYDSGFKSKTAFNLEFKKVFGVTPSHYKNVMNEDV
jgi:AraC-like DNA-binding protein